MIKKLLFLFSVCVVLLASCTKSDPPVTTYYLKSVKFTNDTVTLSVGGKSQLNITLNPTNAVDTQMLYSSADTSIATVGKYGLVTAKKGGNVTITVANTKNTVSATCIIKVLQTVVPISVVGKWNMQVDTFKQYKDGILDTTEVSDNSFGTYFQYNADATGYLVHDVTLTDKDIFTYTIAGNVLTEYYPAQTVDGFPQDAETVISTIKQKTATSLVLYLDYVPEGGGTTYKVTEHIYLTLAK